MRSELGQKTRADLGTPPKASGTGIGAYLSQQRRLRGIALGALAEQTRIPVRSLERLEKGAFDTTSDGFARGFVRTVADALGLDADAAVSRMLAEPENTGKTRPRPAMSLGRRMAFIAGAVAALGLAVVAARNTFDWLARDPIEPVLRLDPVRRLHLEQPVRSGDPQRPGRSGDPSSQLLPLAERRR